MSPTQRTLAMLRKQGYRCAVVEKFAGGVRLDMFGIIDVLAISSCETLGVQCFSTDMAAHQKKICEEQKESSLDWLSGPRRRLWLVGWRKVAAYRKDGTRALRDAVKPRLVEVRRVDPQNLEVIALSERTRTTDEIAPCPCGMTPTALGVAEGDGAKWAYVYGNCCADWHVEFRTNYHDITTPEIKPLAAAAWNSARRGKGSQ